MAPGPRLRPRQGEQVSYHGDYLNSITWETDSSQATTATKQYDAFGMPLSSTGSSASPFGFAGAFGYQEDGDSGLKLLGHRYYDPSTGRFLTRDPAKDGRNWCGYCRNNPVSRSDSSGLIWINLPDDDLSLPSLPEPNAGFPGKHAGFAEPPQGKFIFPGDVVYAIGKPGAYSSPTALDPMNCGLPYSRLGSFVEAYEYAMVDVVWEGVASGPYNYVGVPVPGLGPGGGTQFFGNSLKNWAVPVPALPAPAEDIGGVAEGTMLENEEKANEAMAASEEQVHADFDPTAPHFDFWPT